ncbi:type II toxin-antitoxin system PemK/MazF family toxin [Pseudactinotalea sp. Z1748]|uniref:type II toxin-antitoxin system PemK/MazF family toxin n=1 Tax=Pseudactinotalea sp. Z1748 TaxID=3413027 RepID=UPI003C7E6848
MPLEQMNRAWTCGRNSRTGTKPSLMASPEAPRRGEVWLVSLGARREGEPGKTRPAVVVSTDALRSAAPRELIVVVPLSSSSTPSALRIEVEPGVSGLDQPSRAMCRAIRSVAATRMERRLGWVLDTQMRQIEAALALILEIPSPEVP